MSKLSGSKTRSSTILGPATLGLSILCGSVLCGPAWAGDSGDANSVANSVDSAVDSDWSFGLQAAPLIFGLSLRYHVNDVWQLQGIVQPAGDELSAAVRVLRTSTQKQYWRSYLFAGYANSADESYDPDVYKENAVTAGMGVEWSWAAKNPSLPPLSWSLELGLGYGAQEFELDFDEPEDEFFLALGASIHYHFE